MKKDCLPIVAVFVDVLRRCNQGVNDQAPRETPLPMLALKLLIAVAFSDT